MSTKFIFLGAGNDKLTLGNGVHHVYGGAGNDELIAYDNSDADTLDGAAGNDTLKGGSQDWLFGGVGDDRLEGGVMIGGKGNDTYRYSGTEFGADMSKWIVEKAGEGTDTVELSIYQPGSFTIPVYIENLRMANPVFHAAVTITGNWHANQISGAGGADVIRGGVGDDTIWGQDGADTLYGENNSDNLIGGKGRDHLFGGFGNDKLDGVGMESATGEADTLEGGAGDDAYIVGAGDVVIELAGKGRDNVTTSLTNWTMAENVEDLDYAGSAAARFTGNALGNDMHAGFGGGQVTMSGGAGNDSITGSAKADRLDGGEHDDWIDGGAGNDNITGGAGRDRILAREGNDVADGGDDDDEIFGFTGNDLLKGGYGADTLVGDLGADTLLGGAGRDSISGGEQNDWLSGNGDADTMDGGSGNDVVFGGGGADVIFGNAGDDVVNGEGGQDILFGGLGRDFFVFGQTMHSISFAADRIADFEKGTDIIALSDIDGDGATGGTDAFHLVLEGPTKTAGDLWIVTQGGDSLVCGDVNGDGFADIAILVEGVTGLGQDDFWF